MNTEETEKLINQLAHYIPNQEQLLIDPQPRMIFHLTLPAGIRAGIDSSPYRLHKDRPYIVMAVSEQKVLLFATKTIHDTRDIENYINLVPYFDGGSLRAVVVDEMLSLNRQDFIDSNPVYFGSMNSWLFAMCELKHNIAFGKPDAISDTYADQIIQYITHIDPSINIESTIDEVETVAPIQIPIVAPEPKTLASKPIPVRDKINENNELVRQIRRLIINKIRMGKIKRGIFNTNCNDLRIGSAFYDNNVIYCSADMIKTLCKQLPNGNRASWISITRAFSRLDMVNKVHKQVTININYAKSINPVQYIMIKINDDDNIIPSSAILEQRPTHPLQISAT